MKDLNLIPKSYYAKKKEQSRKIYMGLGITGVVVVLASAIVIPLAVKNNYSGRKDDLESQLKETSKYISVINQLNTINGLYNIREQERSSLAKNGTEVAPIIEKVEKALTQNLFVMNFNMSEDSNKSILMTLDCMAQTQDDIAAFTNHLRQEPTFTHIVLTNIKKMGIASAQPADTAAKGKKSTAAAGTNSTYYSFSLNFNVQGME